MSTTILIHKAMLHGARDLRLETEEVDLLTLGEEQVFVETEISALSTGTDLANYQGRSREVPGAPDYPRWVGYNNVGIVRHCGPGVTRLAVGQRVFAPRPHQSGYVAHESDLLVPVPPEVSPEVASLGYLTNLGVSALRQVHYQKGEHVAVMGLGVIGLCTVAIARAMGARVTAIANSHFRQQLALRVGAHAAFLNQQAEKLDAAIVVLTANTWPAYRESVDLCGYEGRIAVLGFPGRAQPAPDFNPLDMSWLYGKQLTITGAGHCPPELRESQLRMIFSQALPLEPIISHRFAWREIGAAYELALTHAKEMTAAIFDWRA